MKKILILEPLLERGMRIRVMRDGSFAIECLLEHGQDIVVALQKIKRGFADMDAILLRERIGSFSASRSALVVARVLSATRGVPLYIVDANLETPDAVMAAIAQQRNTKFEYERPPNIT